jgi:hypothetical protein
MSRLHKKFTKQIGGNKTMVSTQKIEVDFVIGFIENQKIIIHYPKINGCTKKFSELSPYFKSKYDTQKYQDDISVSLIKA